MRNRIGLMLAAVLSTSMSSAHAADTKILGQQLLTLCTANMGNAGNPFEAAQCMGFVVGVANTFDCEETNQGYKWDSSVDIGQPGLVYQVVKYLKTNPAARTIDAHKVIGAALQEAFPCIRSLLPTEF